MLLGRSPANLLPPPPAPSLFQSSAVGWRQIGPPRAFAGRRLVFHPLLFGTNADILHLGPGITPPASRLLGLLLGSAVCTRAFHITQASASSRNPAACESPASLLLDIWPLPGQRREQVATLPHGLLLDSPWKKQTWPSLPRLGSVGLWHPSQGAESLKLSSPSGTAGPVVLSAGRGGGGASRAVVCADDDPSTMKRATSAVQETFDLFPQQATSRSHRQFLPFSCQGC